MGNEKAMKAIETILEKAFKRIQTPTLLPLKTIEPFVHPDHHGQIAKMVSPSGEVLALRYDSTLSLVVSEGAKKQNRVYYMEPKFSFDFNKNRVVETMQIGIERFITEQDPYRDQRIHMVDLDATKGAGKNNRDLIAKLIKHASDLPIQVGGGIRTYDEGKALLDQGVDKIVIGSLLFTDEIAYKRLVSEFGRRLVVALDIKESFVRLNGWQSNSGVTIQNVLETGKLSGVPTRRVAR